MYNLEDYRSLKNRKRVQYFPAGILDVIEVEYPSQYSLILKNQSQMTSLFTNEEWLDILTKSRNSYHEYVRRQNLSRETLAHGI
ncbi:hypothetical protein Desaci_2206 [Desulfosporosinus acidiphilus SJ4]|uniref:Uncharacterized protein n=1 Tax=Desulfosporosinus acidiphilus (strain DSM 22704 / JCM 16185 / SJ4) TaxID=646529 RepID=I4D5U3_DESAJ|nr:hypothetical protein [Desulfosporosinus acidiphilus]AFM41167.1 hypothetical protein Desaci_2206 [Desulfosporosinus acidiphilus SJ4]